MLGTGNDIVSLAAINVERTNQPNFYSKILPPSEKQLYSTLHLQLPFENFVWLAWSVKESAYKFLKRFMPDLGFSPAKIVITKLEPGSDGYNGTVQFDIHQLHFRTVITEDYIFSVVNFRDDFTDTRWGIEQIDSSHHADQSLEVRKLLLRELNELQPGNNFTIDKSPGGWPVILKNDQEISMPVSLAHHDRYVAYSFQIK
ncbi:MAG: 4'-phosphopantetheinyl transferase superfamily protein [Sphingobacteriales bacterium]